MRKLFFVMPPALQTGMTECMNRSGIREPLSLPDRKESDGFFRIAVTIFLDTE